MVTLTFCSLAVMATAWLSRQDYCLYVPRALDGNYLSFVSYIFVHLNLTHVFYDIVSILIVGLLLEQTFGTKRFVQLLFVIWFGSTLAFTLWNPGFAIMGSSAIAQGLIAALSVTLLKTSHRNLGILVLVVYTIKIIGEGFGFQSAKFLSEILFPQTIGNVCAACHAFGAVSGGLGAWLLFQKSTALTTAQN